MVMKSWVGKYFCNYALRHRVFDLSRSIDLHKDSMAHTHEQTIAGRTS